MQLSAADTRKLLTKLTRVAGRKEPAMREADWRDLLRDMLALREKGFKAVDTQECYEVRPLFNVITKNMSHDQ